MHVRPSFIKLEKKKAHQSFKEAAFEYGSYFQSLLGWRKLKLGGVEVQRKWNPPRIF